MSDKWIGASEISSYIYCGHAWWLQRMDGHAPHNVSQLNRGKAHHQQHIAVVQSSIWLRRLAYVLLFCVVALATFQLLTSLAAS